LLTILAVALIYETAGGGNVLLQAEAYKAAVAGHILLIYGRPLKRWKHVTRTNFREEE
jgi:hypothetical protein